MPPSVTLEPQPLHSSSCEAAEREPDRRLLHLLDRCVAGVASRPERHPTEILIHPGREALHRRVDSVHARAGVVDSVDIVAVACNERVAKAKVLAHDLRQ